MLTIDRLLTGVVHMPQDAKGGPIKCAESSDLRTVWASGLRMESYKVLHTLRLHCNDVNRQYLGLEVIT